MMQHTPPTPKPKPQKNPTKKTLNLHQFLKNSQNFKKSQISVLIPSIKS